MEKAKEYPRTGIKIVKIFLGFLAVVWLCIAILGMMMLVELLPIYRQAQSVRDWDVPPNSEILDFYTWGFSKPFAGCPDVCLAGAAFYIESNLNLTDLKNFYLYHYGDHSRGHIGVASEFSNLGRRDRFVYIVTITWII